jgi:predicted Zn-dependent peptidase
MRVACTRLANGLRVVTVAMPHLHAANVSVFARTGSRHEAPADHGLAHFLEHMLFRGCDGFADSTALNAAMEDLGGALDGYTTRDHSGFESTVHEDHAADAIEILGRMFASPTFADLEVERGVVLEELLDSLDSRGRSIDIDDLSHRAAFRDHPLGNPIDGPRRNVRRFTAEDLERHRRRSYGASNLVVACSGAIDPGRCQRAVARAFGGLRAGRAVRDGARPRLPSGRPSLACVRVAEPQTRVRLSFRTVPERHADHVALVVLRRIVDGGLSARLPTEMIERRGLAYDVGADLVCYSDCGLFGFEFAVAPRKLGRAFAAIAGIIAELRDEPVGAAELERVRHRARIGHDLSLDDPVAMAQWFGAGCLFAMLDTPARRLARIQAVGPAELQRVARRYLCAARLTAAAVCGGGPNSVRDARRAFAAFVARLAD